MTRLLGGVCLVFVVHALAGTATFSSEFGDNEARLRGGWVVYLADGLTNPWLGANPGAEAEGTTTNLTALCGSRSLSDLGRITLSLAEPNWDWADHWWGAWIELQFRVAGVPRLTVGIGPPYDWSDYAWVYVRFGATEIKWNDRNESLFQPAAGNQPVAIRIESDGTNLTILASTDGIVFTPLDGASWPIASVPELGDMRNEPLNLEIAELGPCSTIRKFQWTAPTVPDLNQAEVDLAAGGVAGITGLMSVLAVCGVLLLRHPIVP